MAKRYHQSVRDRMNEGEGMARREMHGGPMDPKEYREERRGKDPMQPKMRNMVGPEYYAGVDPRRTQEMQDAGMIQEDPRAIANLPQEVKIKPYNMAGGYLPEDLDDTIAGVDRQMDYDGAKRAEHFYPKKV
jgi:hypothetical protein